MIAQVLRTCTLLLASLTLAVGHAQADAAREAYEREDYAAALKEYEPRAKAGEAEAQYRLGLMHRFGWGVEKDPVAAVRWLRAAADQQHAGAMTELGNMYRLGRGVPEDPKLAAQLLSRAAARGSGFAQLSIGRMYRTGTGVERDLVKAWAWFTLAIENQVMDAVSHRNEIAEQMNEEQLTVARKLADEWREKAKWTK